MIKESKSFFYFDSNKYINFSDEGEYYLFRADDFSFRAHKSFPKDRAMYYVSKLLRAENSDSSKNPFTLKDLSFLNLESLEAKTFDEYFSGFLSISYKDYIDLILEPPKVSQIGSLIEILKELDKEIQTFVASGKFI